MAVRIEMRQDKIEEFCHRWQVRQLCLFGSAIREDFGPLSDVDVMVDFEASAQWSLFDLVAMKQELEAIFERKVDLLTRRSVEASANPIRRKAILQSAECIYAA